MISYDRYEASLFMHMTLLTYSYLLAFPPLCLDCQITMDYMTVLHSYYTTACIINVCQCMSCLCFLLVMGALRECQAWVRGRVAPGRRSVVFLSGVQAA